MSDHRWAWCDFWECPMVICGKCGNNCWNGRYGTLPDGSTCGECPAAYDMQDKGDAPPEMKQRGLEAANMRRIAGEALDG